MFLFDHYPQLKIIQQLARRRKVDVFLVGGFLRDHFLKRPTLDFDFAVDKNAISFARSFARDIKGAFILLDSEHGCARVVKKRSGGVESFDFADFRMNTIQKDLAKRDFTINTLAVKINALSDKETDWDSVILDYKNARRDLKAKRVVQVSASAFRDDPLRVLRAFSLKAMLGFAITPETVKQIKKDKELLLNVSRERVRDELFKILETPNAAKILKEMDRVGVLPCIIPQIEVMYGVKQGAYHHLDVWPHSLETVVQLEKLFLELKDDPEMQTYLQASLGGGRSRRSLIKLACLLHDIGKPESFKRKDGRTFFHGHERIGRKISRFVAESLKLSTNERFALEDMVLWHLRPGYLSNFQKPSPRAVYRYFRDTKDEAVSIAVLAMADQRSTCGPMTSERDQQHHQEICTMLIKEYFFKQKEQPPVRLLDGNDVMKALRIAPSPLVGKILRQVAEEQATGKVQTKQEAIALAKKIVEKEK